MVTVEITVPAVAGLGATVDISATATGQDTIEWKTTGGSIDDPSAADTELTAPGESGVIAVTCVATDADGATASDTAYITVGDPKANIFTPGVRIEIEGVDVTDRRIPRDELVVGKSLDYPELLTFRSSGISFNLDNKDGSFDYNNPNNFFITQGLPAHGRGAKVLVRVGLSQSELIPVFAGEISEVVTRLGDTKANIKARDLSVRSRQKVIENFGIEITRRITDFEGAAADYTALDPVFYIPIWGLPISRNSVSLTVYDSENDAEDDINIVNAINTEGTLSNQNAEIDYARGLIRFEAPPDDGIDTRITATWKRDYRYKRPDFLVRQVLKNTGTQNTLQITDDTNVRFAIEQALLRHPTDAVFSSHGRPYFEKHGITRWTMLDDSGDTPDWWVAHDNRLVKYDEYLDEYEEVSAAPDDDTITDAPPGGYGTEITDEGFMFDRYYPHSVAISPNGTMYVTNTILADFSRVIERYMLDGTQLSDVPIPSSFPQYQGLDYYNNSLYALRRNGSMIDIINPTTGVITSSISYSATGLDDWGISITETQIYVITTANTITILNHDGSTATGGFSLPTGYNAYGIKVTSEYIWLAIQGSDGVDDFIAAFTHQGSEVTSLRIEIDYRPEGLEIYRDKMYVVGPSQSTLAALHVYSLSDALNYKSFSIYRFDTHDYDDFYCLVSNTLSGDIAAGSTFNQIRILKYDSSADTWDQLLDPSNGHPQLAHPVDFMDDIEKNADNRKNFQVVSWNSKTLIFYRRVQASSAGIAYYNETDDTLTNIYSESFGTNDGLPYSMDFVLDERTDGIYVYTFVVKYTLSGSSFSTGTLKVYRERVEPSGSQTEIFSETFTGTTGTDEYPISVSDIILADDRSKFYFVLEYFSESTTEAGKAELCELAKDGTGDRMALKTYNDPLVGPRSPVKLGSEYYYLEGNWYRRPTDDADVPDKFYYPNQGGHLIEIESNGDITDHGIVWRSRTKLDSPDPDPENKQYDGWGLHNAVVSNIVADGRDNLRFIAGYGLPYRANNNLPTADINGGIPDESNFVWLQYGQDLSTKIPSFPTNARRGWELIQQLGQLMNWEIGFGPAMGKVDAVQAVDSSITDWSANGSFFFRPRTILPAKLRTAIMASGEITTIEINDSGLPAEIAEFPVPPSGERYTVIVNKEMFTYTGVTPDAMGRTLTGVSRAQNGSTTAAHAIDAAAYFVDTFASGEHGATLVSIQSRSQDFVNLKNEINVGFGDAIYPAKDQTSIDEHGEKTFNLGTSQPLLSRQDRAWAELTGDIYLDELSGLKEVLQCTLVFSPALQPGQLAIIYQLDRLKIEFKLFRLLQVQHHTHPRWQTSVTALEIV